MPATIGRRDSGVRLHGGVAAHSTRAAAGQAANHWEMQKCDANRLLFLRIALIIIGLTFIFGIYTLSVLWPSGWAWGQGHSHYLMMIIGVYATLGVFLLIVSRNPY